MSHRADASNTLDNRGYSGPLIRGQNPALLLETAMRDRITDSLYWKESCFGLNAATLCDRAVELTHIGGTYGVGMKPTQFICLAFKLLTLVPDREIVLEYLNYGGEEWKYLRALAAFYVRLTFDPPDVYKTLEPLLEDYRKLKQRRKDEYVLIHMDEFVDNLLTKDRVCGTSLWKLPARQILEDLEQLEEKISPLQDELDAMDEEAENGDNNDDMEDVRRNGGTASEDGRSPQSARSSRSRSRSSSRARSRSQDSGRRDRSRNSSKHGSRSR
jgi:pre-mRNA-splicing factor 38A